MNAAELIKTESENFANAASYYAEKYHERKLKHAQLLLKFKREPPADIKVTDPTMEALIEADLEYQAAITVEIAAEYKKILARGALDAALATGKMLNNGD